MPTTIEKLLDAALDLPLMKFIEVAGLTRHLTDPEHIAAEHDLPRELVNLLAGLSDFVRIAQVREIDENAGGATDRVFYDVVESLFEERSKESSDLEQGTYRAIVAFGNAWTSMRKYAATDSQFNYRRFLERCCDERGITIGENRDQKAEFLLSFCSLSIIGVPLSA